MVIMTPNEASGKGNAHRNTYKHRTINSSSFRHVFFRMKLVRYLNIWEIYMCVFTYSKKYLTTQQIIISINKYRLGTLLSWDTETRETTLIRKQEKRTHGIFLDMFAFLKYSSLRKIEYWCFEKVLEASNGLLYSAGPVDPTLKLILKSIIKLSPCSVKFWIQSGQLKWDQFSHKIYEVLKWGLWSHEEHILCYSNLCKIHVISCLIRISDF